MDDRHPDDQDCTQILKVWGRISTNILLLECKTLKSILVLRTLCFVHINKCKNIYCTKSDSELSIHLLMMLNVVPSLQLTYP